MMKTCSITFVTLALLSMCAAIQARVGLQTRDDADEYAVYSAVINKAVFEANEKLAVICGRTVFDKKISEAESANALLQILKPITQGMLQDLDRKNREPQPLSDNMKLNVPYALLKRLGTKTLPASRYFSLSRVGFNNKKDLAVVYFVVTCGSRCGTGNLVLLSKGDRGWEIVKEHRLWVS